MAKNKVIFKLDKNDSIVKDGHVLYRLICDGYKDEPQMRHLNMKVTSSKMKKISANILKIIFKSF